MLQRPLSSSDPGVGQDFSRNLEGPGDLIDLEEVFAAARRQFLVVAICCALCIALGIGYIAIAPAKYSASTLILVDQNTAAVVDRVSNVLSVKQSDELISSQVELLKSEKIRLDVVDALNLANDESLSGSPSPTQVLRRTVASVVRGFLPANSTQTESAPASESQRQNAADILDANLDVSRVGISYVLEVSYAAPNPELAARVANGVADRYLADQLESQDSALRRAGAWLFERIEQLRQQSTDANLAVQRFRTEHNASMQGTSGEAFAESRSKLKELESEAASYQALYESFLAKYQESVQQQSFPITEARIITQAVAPSFPFYPRRTLILGLCLVVGAAIGAAIGAYREFRDQSLRTAAQVKRDLDLDLLGIIPRLRATTNRGRENSVPLWNLSLRSPESEFARTLRKAKVGADLALRNVQQKTIGVISAFPEEGKSTVASNLAMLLALQNHRSLLIDGDFQNPGLTNQLTQDAKHGIVDVLMDRLPVEQAYCWAAADVLAILPAVSSEQRPFMTELLASPRMSSLLEHVRISFDYVLIDLPPLSSTDAVRVLADAIDGFLLVVHWGKTDGRLVRSMLEGQKEIYSKCIGVILNGADPKEIRSYGPKRRNRRSLTLRYFGR